jgi:hypothetical protein
MHPQSASTQTVHEQGKTMLHILPEDLAQRSSHTVLSPLMLGDRLIELAKDADQAGLPAIAERLIRLACDVLEGGWTNRGS